MKILLTNDDGIDSEGIQKLASILRSRGKYKVTVLAPDQNRSGVSSALSIFMGQVKVLNLGEDNWSCSGTPVDCVISALLGSFCEKPDLVISGINKGSNLGTDLLYSGTAAAARQASLFGIPALALSLHGKDPFNWDMAISWAVDHLDEFLSYWKEYSFVNVNIPNSQEGPLGLIPSWPALKNYNDSLSVKETPDGLVCSLIGGVASVINDEGSDYEVISRGYASISTLYNLPVVRKDLCPGVPDYASAAGRR